MPGVAACMVTESTCYSRLLTPALSLCALQAVVDCGALESLVTCLEEFDPGVKEAACWTLGYVAGHSPELAQQVNHNVPAYNAHIEETHVQLKRSFWSSIEYLVQQLPMAMNTEHQDSATHGS